MKKTSLVAVLTVGLLATGIGSLQAGIVVPPVLPMVINASLTVQAQGLESEPSGSSFKSTIIKVKVITRDLLNLLEVAYTNDFTDCSLIVDLSDGPTGGDFMVMDPNGNVLVNASVDGFFSNFFDTESDFIFKGTENASSSSFTDVFTNEIDFQDSAHSNDFFLFGTEEFASSSSSSSGKFKDSFKLTGAGTGQLGTPPGGGPGTSFFMLSGTISGKASGILQ
jgi:hypothetical protein